MKAHIDAKTISSVVEAKDVTSTVLLAVNQQGRRNRSGKSGICWTTFGIPQKLKLKSLRVNGQYLEPLYHEICVYKELCIYGFLFASHKF